MTLAKQLFDLIDYGSEGWGFESLQAHENPAGSHVSRGFYFKRFCGKYTRCFLSSGSDRSCMVLEQERRCSGLAMASTRLVQHLEPRGEGGRPFHRSFC